MHICYMILAHNVPNHFGHLIHALASGSDTNCIVHVDKKSDLVSFKSQIKAGRLSDRVYFIEQRVSVFWGSFAMVQATIKLLRTALELFPNADYYCLISGSDYPIQSPTYIEDYFSRNSGYQFINLSEVPNKSLNKPLSRFTTFRIHTKERAYWKQTLVHVINALKIQRDHTKYLKELRPYAGSQWWALTNNACQYVIDFMQKNPKIITYLRNVIIPDELFFQTIIGNSVFAKRMKRNITYSDWRRKDSPYHPAIIDSDHIDYFVERKHLLGAGVYGEGELLFARKFPDDSEYLVKRIKAEMYKD